MRGPTDYNYAYADGSVQRLNDVKFDDQRVGRVPLVIDGDSASSWQHLPDIE